MNTQKKYAGIIVAVMMTVLLLSSCKDFFNPDQEIDITDDKMFTDWYEYRAAEMGLYALQQDMVEQLMILGELRADLLTITNNADADLVEIHNFNVSKDNKYAKPTKFFKLISACNNFILVLERDHPEVLDKGSEINNYHKLYGEALCMRAWAYFNAVRIYGRVPFIPESLTTLEEIESFVNTSGTYIDSISITYARDGYYNDTTYNEPVELTKNFYDTRLIVDHFANELETKVRDVGVKHDVVDADPALEVTLWNPWAMHALLGQMYLTVGDLVRAEGHLDDIVYNSTESYRYQLTRDFAGGMWGNIFTSTNNMEHILSVYFNKADFQQNEFNNLFLPIHPYKYMLKPTRAAVHKWETSWSGQVIAENVSNPRLTRMTNLGLPNDWYRGYGASYLYLRNGQVIDQTGDLIMEMLEKKSKGDTRGVNNIMDGCDTIVFKYYLNTTQPYQDDSRFIIYRAGGIHLYMAEIYTYWATWYNGVIRTNTREALGFVNDGSNYDISITRRQYGVRGRVGLGSGYDALRISDIHYLHDPFTNKLTGYINVTNNLLGKQKIFEEQLLEERARELAFEGERFYDLMRVAKRRNDPTFLAKIVSEKFPAGQREQIYNYLSDESNWYIKYFEE
ncbi:MAG: RagB/SusD family nutrient uptake outer membrane protein [Bacteroidales bacterium]